MVSRQPVAISSRDFALVFTPLEIEMLTGESETVVLTLTDADHEGSGRLLWHHGCVINQLARRNRCRS